MCSRHEQDSGARKTRIWIQAVKWGRTVMEAAGHFPDLPSQPRHSFSPLPRGLAAETSQPSSLPDTAEAEGPMLHLSQNGLGWCNGSKPSTFYRGLSCDSLSVQAQRLPHTASSLSNRDCFREHPPSTLPMFKRPSQHLRQIFPCRTLSTGWKQGNVCFEQVLIKLL